MQQANYMNLYSELEQYESFGVSMKLNDYPASPMQIVSTLMVKEDQVYMRDYEWDERGQVKGLTFRYIDKR